MVHIEKMMSEHIEECVDLFIDVFTREPWNDVYDSREQVVQFFENHIANNYFVGYIMKNADEVIAMSLGSKKPWIKGMEYYIDHFCVKADYQRHGIGGRFLELIEKNIHANGMNAIILNTEKGFPSEKFYLKTGFCSFEELVILAK